MKSKTNGIKCRTDKSWWIILLAALLIPTACNDRNEPAVNIVGELQVRLLVNTQNPASTRADAPDAAESAIKELRVYVFNSKGEKVGYYYNGNLGASNTYYVPMKLYESGELDFYVLANESGAGITGLNENMTPTDLKAVKFNTEDIDKSKGFLMSCHTAKSITDNTGVTVVECPLMRDLSLVDVYFAKSGNFNATVTNISLTDYTINDELHWAVSTTPTWQRQFSTAPDVLLGSTNTVTVEKIVPEEQQTNPDADYGTTIISHPVTTNPYGTTDWSTEPEAEKKPCLNITYTVGSTEKEATVYLPKVEINCRYNVYCLIKASGVEFMLNVLPWEYEQKEIVWSKQYGFEFSVSKNAAGNDPDKYIEIKHTDTTNPEDNNDVLITFNMTEPVGTPWKASLDNGQDFYFYNEDNESDYSYIPQGVVTDANNSVSIRLKARNKFDETTPKATRLAIRVQSPDQTEGWVRLPINRDKITSGEEDVIWIKQVANQ